jgi:hypothetical protein
VPGVAERERIRVRSVIQAIAEETLAMEFLEVVVFSMVPVSHVVAGIVCLVSMRVSPRALGLGLEFLFIAVANGLMWLIVEQPRFLRDMLPTAKVCYLLGGILGLFQLACYLLIAVGLYRVFEDLRRSAMPRFPFETRPIDREDEPRSWQPRQGGRHDIQP